MQPDPHALVIGGGPAGLMAAEALLEAGHRVVLAEAKPSVARKFLMAGKSGLNLSKMEPQDDFLNAFRCPELQPMIDAFGPEQVKAWAEGLGQEMFTGSSGRLYPTAMKGSPLLRSWLARLDRLGLDLRVRWRWTGWTDGGVCFATPAGAQVLRPAATVLALGGASWARLGSDGAWAGLFDAQGLKVAPFAPSNAALSVPWSAHMAGHFGTPIKNAVFRAGDLCNRGEAILSARGLEGGGIYPLTPALREGQPLRMDLFPDVSEEEIAQRLARPRGKQSKSNHLRRALRLSPVQQALILELARPLPEAPRALAAAVKALALPAAQVRPLDEAISTAGGVPFAALDDGLMLRQRPGTFCAGEMLDWEAPTGGYLLTGCLASGRWSGKAAARWLNTK